LVGIDRHRRTADRSDSRHVALGRISIDASLISTIASNSSFVREKPMRANFLIKNLGIFLF